MLKAQKITRLIFVTALLLFMLPGANAAHRQPPAEDEIPFSLAVRGGVSLGSYEAGSNWAILKYMKALRRNSIAREIPYAELRSVSGASAGSINSLLSAITWCSDDTRNQALDIATNTMTANLFHNSWMGVGFDELLPEPVDSPTLYRPDDGVLSRNAFNPAINGARNMIDNGIFRPNCRVPIGLLVTRVEPVTMVVAGVEVHNQRFMVPIEFFTDRAGKAGFTLCDIDQRDPLLGNVLLLPGKRNVSPRCPYLVKTDDVIDVVEASSAFPMAFGRKQLRFCAKPEAGSAASTGADGSSCPDDYQIMLADFVDGGLFDNIPLGAAKALGEPHTQSESARKSSEDSARRFNYIYIDPTIRRPPGKKKDEKEDEQELTAEGKPLPRTFGIRSQTGFLLGVIETGRDYELYNVLRSGEWGSQVYSYADKLIENVRKRYADTRITISLPNNTSLVSTRCRAIFAAPIRMNQVRNRSDVLSCIASHAQALERVHAGQPVAGRRSHSSKALSGLRNMLIGWIARVARLVDETQLATSVEDARFDTLGDRRILLLRRFSPLTGEMLFSFGAFADPEFRQYDYYAGIYDASWNMANYLCERRDDAVDCLPKRMQQIYKALAIGENHRANSVFMTVLQREFPEAYNKDPRWAWAREQAPASYDTNMIAIANSLFGETLPRDQWPYESPKIGEFISRLTKQRYDTRHSSEFLKRVFTLKERDQLSWYYPLTLRASNRLLLLEQRESEVRPGGRLFNVGLAMGAFVAHSYVREEDITFNNSTAPDNSWQAWLPYEVAVDARNGGLDVSWEPSINLGHKGMALGLKLTPVQFNRFGGNEIWFSHADLFLSYRRGGIFSSFGAGPTMTYTWADWPGFKRTSYGASAYVGLVQDKLRITVGTLSGSGSGFPGDSNYINFGITDVSGIVYWLTKAAK